MPETIVGPIAKDISKSSDYKSFAWRSQSKAWDMTYDVWQSPLDIREKGETYLDKFKRESPTKYTARLNNSVFTSKFRETIEQFGGTVFRSDPAPTEAPTPISELFTDIDGCGNSLHQFLLNCFELYLRDGNGYFFVDAPPAPVVGVGQKPTQADRAKDRPWITFFTAKQLINHRYETIGGKSLLVQATIEKEEMAPDGLYGEKKVCKHLILTRGAYSVEVQNDKKEWINESSGLTGLDEIPLIPIAEIGSTPPLLVLAMLNILFYNKVSDFDSWCHIVCVPERYYKFDQKEAADDFIKRVKEETVSPNAAQVFFGEHAGAFFNEPKGQGIEIAHERNIEVDQQMASLGIGMLAPEEGAQALTAAQTFDMAGRRQSKLARFTRQFENAFEKTLYVLSEYINAIQGKGTVNLGEAEKTSLKLKIDYSRLTLSLDQMRFFDDLVERGRLSLQTFLKLLQNLMELPDGFNPEEETAQIAKEKAANVPDTLPPVGMPVERRTLKFVNGN